MNAFNGAARNNAEPMRFRSLGGWVEQPDDLQPALTGHEHADVVVVGAGFAGLSTALELRARGANVIVLEQQFAGFGASGRNAGYLLGSMGIECEVFVKRVGLEQARKFVGFYDEAVTVCGRAFGCAGHRLRLHALGNHPGRRPSQPGKATASEHGAWPRAGLCHSLRG